MIDMCHYVIGASAVVGTTIPLAVGYALTFRCRKTSQVAVAFFGDGATEEGVFGESINFAAVHRLPVLFVCGNNGLAIHTATGRRWATQHLCERVGTYGIPAHLIESADVIALRAMTAHAIAAMRADAARLSLHRMQDHRWREHVGPNEDHDAGYHSRDEMQLRLANDQAEKLGRHIDSHAARSKSTPRSKNEIAAAISFAEERPLPTADTLETHVFAGI